MLLSGSLPFVPHGQCYLWQPTLVALHGISDSLIAIAYYIIPIGLVYFVRQRSDLPYPIVFWLFSAFIVACGTTHLLEVWTLWHPHYWLSGGVKALTAMISLCTVGTLGPLLSQAIALPSTAQLQAMNQVLQQEISDRQRAEATLRRYERIVSAITDGICLLDRQGIYQIANQAYLDWHQKAADAVIGQPISNVLNPSLIEQKIQPYFDQCFRGEKAQLELWVDHPVFARQFISVSYVPYTELDGTISGVIIDLRNLTNLKQVELALRSSETTQRAILEAIPDLLIHLDCHGRRLNLLSGGEVKLHPLTQTNRCQSIYDTLPPELANLRMQYVHQALTTGQRQVYEHVIDLNGDRRHEETRVVKLNDQEVLLMVRDITERKQAEADLRRYERIVSATTDGISLIDRQYVYQIVNETYLRYNNKRRDEIVGHSVSDLVGAAVFNDLVKPHLDACLAGETIHYEAWFDFSALGRQFIRVTYSPYRALDGTITGIVASTSNLTALKQAEQARQESEMRFRGIFDQMYQFIGLLAPDGTLLEANQTALQFAGATLADVINRPFWEAPWWQISPATQEQLQSAIARAAQGEFVRYEVDVQGLDHQIITLDFSLRPIFNEAQQVALLIPEGRDITERKQAQQQIELQAVITRNMAGGICLVNADDGTIVYANPKFEQMFGYDPGELTGKHASIVNYATEELSAEAINQTIRAAVLAHQEATYEVHNVKKDGTPFWCRATTSVFEHPAYGKVLVAVQQDISEQKKAEDQLRASLEEKELLLKEIYHRVKNNLQVIYSLLNLQSRHLKDPAALAALKDSQSRVRAMALVHEKLYQSPSLSHIDFADYITSLSHSLLAFYQAGYSTPNLTLNLASFWLDIETAIPCGLILTELISNALKHAFPEGFKGELEISLTRSSADHVTLSVQDNGIGMAPDIDLKTMPSLGLQLVRNLAQQIKGSITLSPQHQGTQFLITFPI